MRAVVGRDLKLQWRGPAGGRSGRSGRPSPDDDNNHRRLGDLAERLEQIAGAAQRPAAPAAGSRRLWGSASAACALFAAGLVASNALTLLAVIPGLGLVLAVDGSHWASASVTVNLALLAPALAAIFLVTEAVIVALTVRLVSRLIKPGWQPAFGATWWALWFTHSVFESGRNTLFSLYATVYTRPWLRLAGIRVGRRTEVSTATGLTRLSRLGATSFATDDVVFMHARSRGGWLLVAPISVGDRSFLGNSAILEAGTVVGDDSLVGLLTTAPLNGGDGTSWLGSPALELPRKRRQADPRLTTLPSRRRVAARAATELVRILYPTSVAIALGALMFYALDVAASRSIVLMAIVAPVAVLAVGVLAASVTIATKWALMGRYRRGDHPLWSFFVWRDEIINSCQEQLAGPMLIKLALGTPLMSFYLRAMGAKVGRDVWCDTLNITEFDMVEMRDGAVANRHSVIETHLLHDRVLQIGPGLLDAGATLGPYSTMLPDTEIGADCSVGGRSIVMRGERLPARTRWQGAPVVAV